MKTSFKPAWWLPNSHLQTLWSTLCRPPIKNLPLINERIELPDGDFIDLNWMGSGKGPIVLLLHGFEGSIESHYAKGMLQAMHRQGWRGVFMHFRGCSGEPNRLARCYHSGDTADVALIIKRIREREPQTPLAAIGFSLSGNVLLKWLGETGVQNPLSAAIAVSVPFELHKTTQRIRQGFSRIYERHMVKCVYERLSFKFNRLSDPIKLPPFSEIRSLEEFDDKVTAPLHGFMNAMDYYTKSSSRQYLHAIRVPTLLLQAKDDPFMTKDIIPTAAELPQDVQLELTEAGGHVGFVGGKYPWRPEYWLEKRAPEFFKQYLK